MALPRLVPLLGFISRRVVTISVLIAIFIALSIVARDPGRIGIAREVDLSDPKPDVENAFLVRLSGIDASLLERSAEQRLIECTELAPTKRLERFLGWSYVFQYFDDALPKRFPNLTVDACWRIGKSNRLLQFVRSRGAGSLFSEQGIVYFSTSDNSDPRFNGRHYRLDVSTPFPQPLIQFIDAIAILLVFALSAHLLRMAARLYIRLFRVSVIFRNLAPGLLISVLVVCFIYAAAEFYLRYTIPFVATAWPSHFDPRVGFIFDPNTTLKHSDGIEFWTETKVNSLGFLDREPKIPKPEGTFRVLVIGDSFVEAAQVEVEQKFPVLLEKILNRRAPPGPQIDTVAMGYSGTGQVNQIAFYDTFGQRLDPDLVILLFVFNDFANNSSLLEAVRNGWSPDHPPRLFLRRTASGSYERFGLESNWQQHLLPVPRDQPYDRLIVSHANYIRGLPEFDDALGDWRPPDDLGIENMFYAVDMPPAFDEALDATAQAFRVFSEYGHRDGFSLLIVATPHQGPLDHPTRHVDPLLAHTRLREMAAAQGIALLDLSPGFTKRGSVSEITFKLDSHWNARGHQWAAEEIADYLLAHPTLIRR